MQDIGNLEVYVQATGAMLFFLSKHYFTSRNCLREVKASLEAQRPLVLVHEQQEDKGGGPLEALRAECREEMRSYLFDGHMPIVWHRISHYQNLTLKFIATEMLRHGPKYHDALHNSSSQLAHFIATAHHQRSRNSLKQEEQKSRRLSLVEWLGVQAAKTPAVQEQETAAVVKVQAVVRGHSTRQMSRGALIPAKELSLVLPGEINVGELALPRPLVLWCSAANPGAAAIAQELTSSLASGGHMVRVVERKPNARLLDAQGESAAMLLYLNKDTWAGQPSVLEHDVRNTYSFAHGLGAGLVRMGSNMWELARTASNMREPGSAGSGRSASDADKIRIVLVHENDLAKGGCEFGTFFATTPQGLIEEGIYKDIAIALHTPPHRAVSLALLAQALGATKDAARQAARQGRASRVSFSSASASSSPGAGGGAAAVGGDVEVASL